MTVGKKSVLVLDDSPIILEIVKLTLEANGFAVRTAINLDELERERAIAEPDVYILDVQMPEAFGDDVGQVLRDVRTSKAPIVLFSSLDESLLSARARDAGFEYVTKDSGVGKLVERILAILER